MYQVVVTDTNCLVAGAVFQDPVTAVLLFAMYSNRPLIEEVTFRKIGTPYIQTNSSITTYATVIEKDNGDSGVSFSLEKDHAKLIQAIHTLSAVSGCKKISLINMKTAEVDYVYENMAKEDVNKEETEVC